MHFGPQADIDACVEYIKGCAKRARRSWRDALRISEYVQGDHITRPLLHHLDVLLGMRVLPQRGWPVMTSVTAGWTGAIDRFQPPGAAQRMGGNMEISVTKLQPPWKGWPLRNVRIKHMASDKLMGEVGTGPQYHPCTCHSCCYKAR
jgi:hypothetical protein